MAVVSVLLGYGTESYYYSKTGVIKIYTPVNMGIPGSDFHVILGTPS